jgi:hypothetical protein
VSREIKRVPLDFDWPRGEPWKGFLLPENLREDNCPDCESGDSSHARHLKDLWYGNVPFDPTTNGSTPFSPDHPAVRARAESNIRHAPEYYGDDEAAVLREAQRLAYLFNSRWSHHLDDDDVAALIEANRLWAFTHTWTAEGGWVKKDPPVVPAAAEVNEWSLQGFGFGFGHDSTNSYIVIKARCAREGVPDTCATCGGNGHLEAYPGQRAEAEAWEPTPPPTGEGWQMWETGSEGSPASPVFPTAEELAQWLTTREGGKMAGPSRQPMTISQAREFVNAGWAPTLVLDAGGLHDGATYVGTARVLAKLESADTGDLSGQHAPDGSDTNDADGADEDAKLAAVASARTLTDSGKRHNLEEVAAELGVDLNDETDSDTGPDSGNKAP